MNKSIENKISRISNSELDDSNVGLKFTSNVGENNNSFQSESKNQPKSHNPSFSNDPKTPIKLNLQDIAEPTKLTHFEAIFMKRFQYARRDKKAAICAIFLPLLLLTIGIIKLL